MDCRVFSFALLIVTGCTTEYDHLETYQQGGSEVGEVWLCGGWVGVEFDFTYEEITFRNESDEWYYVEVIDFWHDIPIASTSVWDVSWWFEDVYTEEAIFEHGIYVEVNVYDVFDVDFDVEYLTLNEQCDWARFVL